jgi:SAM-dependent methyltransferase
MNDLNDRIRKHWAARGDLARIVADLERRGFPIARLGPEDLAGVDQLHAGLLEATRELAKWAALKPGERVIDVGAGLGGPARLLAREPGCAVTALELSPELHAAGQALTEQLGLAGAGIGQVSHVHADALVWEGEGAFDVVLLQHLDLHFSEKVALYGRCRSLLAPGLAARVVWHDWLAGPGGDLVLPVPWSDAGEDISFLSTMDVFRQDLVAAGLALHRFQPLPAETALWLTSGRERLVHVLERDDVDGRERLEQRLAEVEGLLRNLAEHRVVPFFAEARRVE